jgi:hypothetical protein
MYEYLEVDRGVVVKKGWLQSIKYLLIISLILPFLAACSVADTVKVDYPLESVNGSGKQTSYVYRAAGFSVKEVASKLSEQRKPEQKSSPNDDRMFLVYSNEIINIQKDPKNPKDTLIEVDSKEYVRKNYSPGFLEGYLLSSLINKLFDYGKYGGTYRGYSTKDVYKPNGTYRTPTVEDKKVAPPMTVERSGSIFRRSKNADTTPTNIVKDAQDSKQSRNEFVKPKPFKPNIKSGSGKITRRRR